MGYWEKWEKWGLEEICLVYLRLPLASRRDEGAGFTTPSTSTQLLCTSLPIFLCPTYMFPLSHPTFNAIRSRGPGFEPKDTLRRPTQLTDALANTTTGPPINVSANYETFDDFLVFSMEIWTISHFARRWRKLGSFLRQHNGYLAISTFRNREYRTGPFLAFWKMSFFSLQFPFHFCLSTGQLKLAFHFDL